MKRVVKPEILDELDGSDPRAIRSRRDLRFINLLMGNERWIQRSVNSTQRKRGEKGVSPRTVTFSHVPPLPSLFYPHGTPSQIPVPRRDLSCDGSERWR